MSDRVYSVVGVMPPSFGSTMAYWLPFAMTQAESGSMTFVGVTSRLREGVTLEAAAVEANVLGHQLRGIPVSGITTVDQVLSSLHTTPRFYAVLLTIFGSIAACIAAIGVYGVLAYSVTQRTREIGIRTAMGARPADVLNLVLGQATVLVALGIGFGLLGAVGLTRYLGAMLFGLTPLDSTTYLVVAFVFAAVAMLASYVPARRAMSVDPLTALRFE